MRQTSGHAIPDFWNGMVDGKPAERVLVQLTSTAASNGLSNDAYPSGYSDASASLK